MLTALRAMGHAYEPDRPELVPYDGAYAASVLIRYLEPLARGGYTLFAPGGPLAQ